MTRTERLLEWVMTRWGQKSCTLMWADSKVLRALGLLMALAGILCAGVAVGLFVLVDSAKKRCSARSASR